MAEQVNREPGWYPDPGGIHDSRWWDGDRWADTISDSGVAAEDPLDAPHVLAGTGQMIATGNAPPIQRSRARAGRPELGELFLFPLYVVFLVLGFGFLGEAIDNDLVFVPICLIVGAFVASKVGYRARDALLLLIPFYGVFVSAHFVWRLACYQRHYWSDR